MAVEFIKVTKDPGGEAPEWVRLAWLEVPRLRSVGRTANRRTRTESVTGLVSRQRVRAKPSYRVVAQEAVEALALVNRPAAAWFRANCPYVFKELGHAFEFPERCCEVVATVST